MSIFDLSSMINALGDDVDTGNPVILSELPNGGPVNNFKFLISVPPGKSKRLAMTIKKDNVYVNDIRSSGSTSSVPLYKMNDEYYIIRYFGKESRKVMGVIVPTLKRTRNESEFMNTAEDNKIIADNNVERLKRYMNRNLSSERRVEAEHYLAIAKEEASLAADDLANMFESMDVKKSKTSFGKKRCNRCLKKFLRDLKLLKSI